MKQQFLVINAIRQAVISALPDIWVTNTRPVKLFPPPPKKRFFFLIFKTNKCTTHKHTYKQYFIYFKYLSLYFLKDVTCTNAGLLTIGQLFLCLSVKLYIGMLRPFAVL